VVCGVVPELLVESFGRGSMHCTTQVGLQALIQSFRLTIRLGMVRRTHDQLSVREFKQLLPHIIQENVIMIRNDSMWKSMQAIDMVKVYLSHAVKGCASGRKCAYLENLSMTTRIAL
jgi:hypothetical protein